MKVHKQVVMCCITQTSYVVVVAEVVAGGTPKSFNHKVWGVLDTRVLHESVHVEPVETIVRSCCHAVLSFIYLAKCILYMK